jgi:hypothetical protein
MPQKNKKRGNEFDGRARNGQSEGFRCQLAHVAAKLIADGAVDFHTAKLKAARQLGWAKGVELPDDHEVEVALQQYLALFKAGSQPRILSEYRAIALRCMKWLSSFDPSLIGASVNGTATEYSQIEIELVGVDIKQFDLFLLKSQIDIEFERAGRGMAQPHFLRYLLTFEDVRVRVSLFASYAQHADFWAKSGKQQRRLKFAEAEREFNAGISKTK